MYNAMTYTDVRSFALSMLQEVTEEKTGVQVDRLSRNQVDDEEVSLKVAEALVGKTKFTKAQQKKAQADLSPEEQAKYSKRRRLHNVIVIDEVD